MMNMYAVAGNPILHSKSPTFFNTYFKKNDIYAHYSRILAENMADVMKLFKILGLDGINITAPFKNEAMKYCDIVMPQAGKIGAINLIKKIGDKILGTNTDIVGVEETLKQNGIDVRKLKVAVIGAGNAAKAVLQYLKNAECESIFLLNRISRNSTEIAERFGVPLINIQDMAEYPAKCDLMISTLPGIFFELREEWFKNPNLIIFDANYKNSNFEPIAKKLNLKFIDGTQWLINQAEPNLEIFTGEVAENPFEYFDDTIKKNSNGNISLIGFSGVGKTTIGARLASILNKDYLDTDTMIELCEKKSIPEIFIEKGEKYFRQIESEVLQESLRGKNTVIATGGGIIEDPDNRKLLRENSDCVWLVDDINACLKRIKIGSRPLLSSSDKTEKAKLLFDRRKELYFRTSELIVLSSGDISVITDLLAGEFA